MANPQLQAPGAGLPFIESLVLKYWIFPRYVSKSSWEKNLLAFQKETKKIIELARGLSETQLKNKVLIERLRGLEDSSRNWSVLEAMEHLSITAPKMARVIQSLSAGQVPQDEKVDTAKVKPKGIWTQAAGIEEFGAKMSEVEAALATIQNPQLEARHFHPWFGPMNALEWTWLLGGHQALHRRQIESILKLL